MSGVLLVAEPVRRKGNCGARLVGTVSRPGGRGVVSTLRKVGAPQGRMLASGQSGRPAGKCHREQTADGPALWDRAQVRVKRCGKSAPAAGVTWPARQPPSGARPNRERAARPLTLPGRPHRWMVTHPDPRKGPVDRTPPIGRLTVTPGYRSVRPPGQRPPRTPRRRRLPTLGAAPLSPPRTARRYQRSPPGRGRSGPSPRLPIPEGRPPC